LSELEIKKKKYLINLIAEVNGYSIFDTVNDEMLTKLQTKPRMTPEDFLTVKGTGTSYKPCKLYDDGDDDDDDDDDGMSCAMTCIFVPQIHYLICLSANYAHIRDHEKFQELQEMQYLQDPELSVAGSKDRF